MSERKEVIFSDLGNICTPACNISDFKEIYKWNRIPYETAHVKGTLLVSTGCGRPEPVSFDPGLTGWYRLFVAVATYGAWLEGGDYVGVRLSDDEAVMHISVSNPPRYAYHSVEESYWRAADMTGQRVEISKHQAGADNASIIAWVRAVPMSDDEVAAFQAEQERTDTKRIYATNDMHGMFCMYGLREPEQWKTVVQEYIQSDVEWFSMENVTIFDGEVSTGNRENFIFLNKSDRDVQYNLKRYTTPEMWKTVVDYGRKLGLKMCISMRMGAWGIEFPDDQKYFVNSFKEAHPELRCMDRDGTYVDAMSYVYPETRAYIIREFVKMAGTGCDAVEMIYSRGVPYVLFEKPFCDRFEEKYGEDPRPLPLDDPRVTDLRCEIMTEFVRELRAALDEVRPGIGLHARCQYSLYDARHVAVDVGEWAREGLITAIISYPQRIREQLDLDADIWADEAKTKLDIEKYTKYYRERFDPVIFRRQDFNFMEPMIDSKGVPQGPASQEERIAEFMAIEKKYGVPVYFEIMPREMSTDVYRDRALELYRGGAEHISMWDTYGRVRRKAEWSMMRRLGHKDELASYDSGEGEYYETIRILRIGDQDVSRYKPAWGG